MVCTYKLIRCTVSNADGEQRVRLVELELFKLWKYMMMHEHGMQVDNITLCVWMTQQAYQQGDVEDAPSGVIEAVDRIVLSMPAQSRGLTETMVRYAPHHDTEQMKTVLLSHVSDTIKQTGAVVLDVHPGYCMIKSGGERSIHLGLAGGPSESA